MCWFSAALLCVVLVGSAPVASAQAPELSRAQAFLREGKSEEAWRLLSPLERQHAGQPDFDYLLAVAALESGRPNLATFILERVVVVNPGHVAARLELARAFFALGDFERAEREFQLVLRSDPPPGIRALVSQYQEKMRAPIAVSGPGAGFSGYVEAALGHDTNANAATAQASLLVPSLGTELLFDPAFVRDGDDFASLAAGVEYARALGGNLTAVAGADLQMRSYAELDTLDSRTTDLHLGLRHRLDLRDSVHYTLRHNEFELDHARYRRMRSAAAEWSRFFGEHARLAVSAQAYRIRYLREDVSASSSDMVVLGASGAYVLDASTRTIAIGALLVGTDDAVAGRADGDRRMYGVRMALQRRLAEGVDGYASSAWLDSDYRRQNQDFGITRRDHQLDLALGLSWQMAEAWFLQPQIARTRNRSNIEINDYRRTQTWLTLRREWD